MSTDTLTLFDVLFRISWSTMFLGMVFYVLFGQVTVRKLRKNPETKNALGIEFASGWDILNVAGALALPRWLNRKLRNTPLSYLYANAKILDKNTTRLDRVLAIVFYTLYVYTGLSLILLGIFNYFGVFD